VRLKFETSIARLSDNLALLATTLATDSRLQNALASRDSEALRQNWTETLFSVVRC
jgi:hypothetical protein